MSMGSGIDPAESGPSDVADAQLDRPADGAVGSIARRHGSRSAVETESFHDRTVDHDNGADGIHPGNGRVEG